jgi:thiol-disulfide isomerase/thioredoxin
VNDRPGLPRAGAVTGLLIAGVLLASAAAGFLVHRFLAPSQRTLYAVPAAGTPLLDLSSGAAAAGRAAPVPTSRPLPTELPDIALPGPDGVMHRLTDWKGKPMLINFWATWCDPCRREIPLLKSLRHEHAADALQVVGIAVDSPEAVRQYAAGHGIDYPVLIGQEGGLAAVGAFGMDTVLPFTVFADSQGRLLTLKIGELHRDEAELILERLREIDRGTLSLSAAREQVSAEIQRLNAARVASGG